MNDQILKKERDLLIKRGYCCESGCRVCPYKEKQNLSEEERLAQEILGSECEEDLSCQ